MTFQYIMCQHFSVNDSLAEMLPFTIRNASISMDSRHRIIIALAVPVHVDLIFIFFLVHHADD